MLENIAVDAFTDGLLKFGYDGKKLMSIFGKEDWIMEIYNAYQKKEIKDTHFDSFNFLGLALSSLKRRTARSF